MPQVNSPEDFIGSLPKKLLDQGVTGLITGACGAGCVVAAKTYAPNLDMTDMTGGGRVAAARGYS